MIQNCYHCLFYQSHRCRNQKSCPEGMHYEEYTGSTVKQCLCATTEVYQDGYIQCPILDCTGCEKCMEQFGDGSDYEREESQNYERLPRWQRKGESKVSDELQETTKYYEMMNYKDSKAVIKSNISQIYNNFVAIGYYLKHIRNKEMYLEDGYQSIWDMAQAEFGFSQSWASRCMSINDRFSKDGNSPILLDEYKGFDKSKLSEMLTLTDQQLEQVTIATTVAEIKDIKRSGKSHATSHKEPEVDIKPSGQCIHRPEFPCTLPEASKLAIGNGEKCNAKCCWGCDKHSQCGYECNSSHHRPVVTETVPEYIESVIKTEETVIKEPENVIPEKVCSNCNYNDMDPDEYSEYCLDEEKEFPCNSCDDKLNHWEPRTEKPSDRREVIETVEADIIQMLFTDEVDDNEDDENQDHETYSVFDIDSEMTSLMQWLEEFRKDNSKAPARRKSKMRWDAICLLDKQVREANIPKDPKPEQQRQPELPILKNNDQRSAWIEAYTTWPLWIDQIKTEEKYYRYDFENGEAFVIRVRLHHKFLGWDKGGYSKTETEYNHEEYWIERPDKLFSDCETNKSALVEYLKDIQKKGA